MWNRELNDYVILQPYNILFFVLYHGMLPLGEDTLEEVSLLDSSKPVTGDASELVGSSKFTMKQTLNS